jgi:NADH dehydrogenase/putative oxidoreductase
VRPITPYDSNRLRARLAAFLDISLTVLRAVAPFVDLLVRLSLAKAFFAPGMLPGGDIGDFHATWPIIAARLTGPVLLTAGFLVKPLALLMLALTLSAPSLGAPQDEHLFWAALFGWYVVRGAGPVSLDNVLAKGLAHSPLPLAGPAMAALRWVSREIGPFYLLAIRLWLAAALVRPVTMHAMLPTMEAGMVPRPLAIVGAALLALGLLTPVVAAGLLVGASGMAMAGADQGMTIYGALLLALLGVFGAGRYSLDRLIIDWAHRALPVDESAPHVVIVGAGFGGMACAAGLRHERARVTLIDRHNYHLFQPLLYQVATAALSPADIATPIRGVFRDKPRLRVLCGTVTAVDVATRRLTVDGRAVGYDAVVLATGATHGYFGHEEWAACAPGLKSVQAACSGRT